VTRPLRAARRLARRYLPSGVRRALRRTARPAPAAAAPAPEPRDSLVTALARGRPLDRALIWQVRALLRAGKHGRAQSIAEGLRAQPETEALGRLAAGIVAQRRGFAALAHEELRGVPRLLRGRLAAAEYARAGLSVAPEETLAELRSLAAEDPPQLKSKTWYDLLAPVYGVGEGDVARALYAIFERHVDEDAPVWRDAARHRAWMGRWIGLDPDSPAAPRPPRRTLAILDYGHPGVDRGSANLGDHVQSLAALAHLVRHRGVRLHGPDALVGLLEQLRARTRPERVRDEVQAEIEVRTVHRDASAYESVAEDTWVLCFGWFMHALFGVRHGFPLHRNLRPVFVSFHCNKRGMLTPAAIEYLRRYGPVGCRDWTTVDLLLSLDVPAFFSGCLTTTIDTVFPDAPAAPADAPVAYVDVGDAPPGGVSYRHSNRAIRARPFVRNATDALERLDVYRTAHSRVVTSRLHCYLPLRSIGVDVQFVPDNPADIRFDGLVGLDDGAFGAMRDRLLDRMEAVLAAILSGSPETEVYALWRDINAADVAAAAERHRRPARLPPARVEEPLGEPAVHGTPAPGAVACVVTAANGARRTLPVLAASLLEHASCPLHLIVLAQPGTEAARERLLAERPELPVTWLPIRDAARARVRLPELLPDVDRAVVLPLPAVATADVAELAALDLGDSAVAAPTAPGLAGLSGFGVIHAAAGRLRKRPEAAAELRRTAHARHRFDFDAFSTDVLVLDLARLRAQGFTPAALALVDAYRLDDREALHVLVGPDRAVLPERWAVVPTRTTERGPGLVHWADPVKPWQRELTPRRELWRRYA
jgi:hypothetical protein